MPGQPLVRSRRDSGAADIDGLPVVVLVEIPGFDRRHGHLRRRCEFERRIIVGHVVHLHRIGIHHQVVRTFGFAADADRLLLPIPDRIADRAQLDRFRRIGGPRGIHLDGHLVAAVAFEPFHRRTADRNLVVAVRMEIVILPIGIVPGLSLPAVVPHRQVDDQTGFPVEGAPAVPVVAVSIGRDAHLPDEALVVVDTPLEIAGAVLAGRSHLGILLRFGDERGRDRHVAQVVAAAVSRRGLIVVERDARALPDAHHDLGGGPPQRHHQFGVVRTDSVVQLHGRRRRGFGRSALRIGDAVHQKRPGGILHLREPRHVDVRIPLRHRLQPLARSQRLEIRFGVRRVGDQVDPVVRIRLEIGPPGPERHHTLTHAAGRNPLVVPFHARRIEYQHVEPIDARLDGGGFGARHPFDPRNAEADAVAARRIRRIVVLHAGREAARRAAEDRPIG